MTKAGQRIDGRLIRRWREYRGLTQTEFAAAAGCTESHVRGLEAKAECNLGGTLLLGVLSALGLGTDAAPLVVGASGPPRTKE